MQIPFNRRKLSRTISRRVYKARFLFTKIGGAKNFVRSKRDFRKKENFDNRDGRVDKMFPERINL